MRKVDFKKWESNFSANQRMLFKDIIDIIKDANISSKMKLVGKSSKCICPYISEGNIKVRSSLGRKKIQYSTESDLIRTTEPFIWIGIFCI